MRSMSPAETNEQTEGMMTMQLIECLQHGRRLVWLSLRNVGRCKQVQVIICGCVRMQPLRGRKAQ